MPNAIRDCFESRAPTWNDMLPNHLDEALRQMVAPFAGTLRAARSVLEIGTGTGALIPHLVNCAPDVRLVSIDLTYGMLLQAHTRCPQAHLVEADAHRLPFASGQQSWFDIVICHNSFPHFADRLRALGEIRRVLRPEGQLFILHNNPRERVNAIHTGAGDPIAFDLLPPGKDLHRMLVQAGYTSDHYLARARCP